MRYKKIFLLWIWGSVVCQTLFFLPAKVYAAEYTCNSENFKYSSNEVNKWEIPFPVDRRTTQFPLVLYNLYDPISLLFPLGRLPRQDIIYYRGYILVDSDWHVTYYTGARTTNYFTPSLISFIDTYHQNLREEDSFEEKKAYFVKHFLKSDSKIFNIFILGPPGEPPDDSFVPILNRDIFNCSEISRVEHIVAFDRLYDKDFSIFRPTNLKPGMRVLLPVPPPDLDDRPE